MSGNRTNDATSPSPGSVARYLRLYRAFVRYCLVREMSFQTNFLMRCAGSVFFLFLLVTFFQLIFLNTERIGDWDRYEYLFFMGTGFLLNALVNGLFVENCTQMAELIRTGDLDFSLTKPIDEQFLLTCQRVDFSAVPNILVGAGLVTFAAVKSDGVVSVLDVVLYAMMLLAGVGILYGMLLALASSSVWIVRNRGLYELWWYVNQFARYPADIYGGNLLGWSLYFLLMFALPVLLAVNTPARYLADLPTRVWMVAYLFVAAAVSLIASRWFFRYALKAYRSASS